MPEGARGLGAIRLLSNRKIVYFLLFSAGLGLGGTGMEKTIHSAGHRSLVALLIHARRSAGLTQVELAEKLGRNQSFVSIYETGQRRIDVVEFATICDALGVKAWVLMRRWEQSS